MHITVLAVIRMSDTAFDAIARNLLAMVLKCLQLLSLVPNISPVFGLRYKLDIRLDLFAFLDKILPLWRCRYCHTFSPPQSCPPHLVGSKAPRLPALHSHAERPVDEAQAVL